MALNLFCNKERQGAEERNPAHGFTHFQLAFRWVIIWKWNCMAAADKHERHEHKCVSAQEVCISKLHGH